MQLTFVSLALALTSVSAHTIFQELLVNGVRQGRTVGIRVPEYNGPIENVNSRDVICNGGINPYRQPVSQTVIKVPAGAEVGAQWHHTLMTNTGDNSDPVDPSHNGPILAYIAKVPSATQTDVTGLQWTKIYEDGLDSRGWAVQRLTANGGVVSFKMPECIPSGHYLLRVELIALHAASNYPGAQLYMECAQIEVTGGGNTTPGNTVSFPGAYSGTDPGIRFNLYQGATSYKIPGPAVWTCNSTPGQPQPQPTTTTSAASPTPTTPAGTVPQYGQCGGQGYTGPTGCVSPFTCKFSNDWYSQCL